MNYYTADTHFCHASLIEKMGRKGFTSMEEHDRVVLENINRIVTKKDFLYILGDFAWKNPQKYRMGIQCKNTRLVLGNHDKPLASKNVFGETPHLRVVKSDGRKFVLCHYPMAYWPASHHGAIHLYGHVHAAKELELTKAFPQRLSMDVGIDSAIELLGEARPFSETEVLTLLSNRRGHHHVEKEDSYGNEHKR